MSQATAARPVDESGSPEPPEGLRLAGVVLCGEEGQPLRAGMTLVVDGRGVVLVDTTATERVLPWHRITGWQVDAWDAGTGTAGALVTYRTLRATYRFGVADSDPAGLRYLVEELGRGYVTSRVPPAPVAVDEPPAPSAVAERVRRLRPVLVIVLIVVLAVMVTLILLQSAGVIHLPWLGGNGSGAPSGMARGVPRGG